MCDIWGIQGVGVYEKGGKTTTEVQDIWRYDDVNPDHVQTNPLLRGEGRQIFFLGPKFFARLRKWLTEP